VCFSSCLIQGTPYPCREAGSHGRESVAVEARNSFAIGIAHGRKRGMATVMNWFNARRGRNLSVSANSPHPRSVHANNHVHKQSVFMDRQWRQLSMNEQRQRSRIVCSQAKVVNHPRPRIGHGRDLSAVADRQCIMRVAASRCPPGRQPISRFKFK
jgi:hypothetical protein